MKRVAQDVSKYLKAVSFNALKDINPTRLKLFAAAAIEFTSLEHLVDICLQTLIGLQMDEVDVVPRIAGFDAKSEIIKSICRDSETLRGEPATLIAVTLGEIGKLKACRDAVIHANLHHPKATIARTSVKRGKPYEVDLSVNTLRKLVQRIRGIQLEMVSALRMSEHHFSEIDLEMNGYRFAVEVTEHKVFQRSLTRLRARHARRKFLPKIPVFHDQNFFQGKSQ
jgi:hypothetical protein